MHHVAVGDDVVLAFEPHLAETIAYDDYVTYGGEAGARDVGKMRLEGKDYIVADGDVMHFRFAT